MIECTCHYEITNLVKTQYVLFNFDYGQYVLTCTDICKNDPVTEYIPCTSQGILHTEYVLGTDEYERVHPA